MIGEPDDQGNTKDPKLPEAKSIRELGVIINDDAALDVFKSTNGTLAKALARFEVDHPEDWQPALSKAESVLASLTPDKLRALQENEVGFLTKLRDRLSRVLTDREKLLN